MQEGRVDQHTVISIIQTVVIVFVFIISDVFRRNQIKSLKTEIQSLKTATDAMKLPYDMAMDQVKTTKQIRDNDAELARQEIVKIKQESEDLIKNSELTISQQKEILEHYDLSFKVMEDSYKWERFVLFRELFQNIEYPILIFAHDFLEKNDEEKDRINNLLKSEIRKMEFSNKASDEVKELFNKIVDGSWPRDKNKIPNKINEWLRNNKS